MNKERLLEVYRNKVSEENEVVAKDFIDSLSGEDFRNLLEVICENKELNDRFLLSMKDRVQDVKLKGLEGIVNNYTQNWDSMDEYAIQVISYIIDGIDEPLTKMKDIIEDIIKKTNNKIVEDILYTVEKVKSYEDLKVWIYMHETYGIYPNCVDFRTYTFDEFMEKVREISFEDYLKAIVYSTAYEDGFKKYSLGQCLFELNEIKMDKSIVELFKEVQKFIPTSKFYMPESDMTLGLGEKEVKELLEYGIALPLRFRFFNLVKEELRIENLRNKIMNGDLTFEMTVHMTLTIESNKENKEVLDYIHENLKPLSNEASMNVNDLLILITNQIDDINN